MKIIGLVNLTIINLICSSFELELKFFFELFRNGDRAPWGKVNPTDILNQTWQGESELTLSGIRQHFLLGHELRNRYIINQTFLDKNYNSKQLYVISTDTNRTIMSAYSQLMGLYPPSTGPNITDNQTDNAIPPINVENLDTLKKQLGNAALPNNTQIFPIHVFSPIDNFIDLQNSDRCKSVKDIKDKNRQKKILNDSFNNFTSKYPDLGNQINYSLNNWSQLQYFADAFVAGYFDQKTYPNITYNLGELFESCKDLLKQDIFEVDFGDENEMISRNAMSPIIKRLQLYFSNIINHDNNNDKNNDPKMVLYSSHDSNVAALLIFLNKALNLNLNYSYASVQFASNIIIEFYKNENAVKTFSEKDYYINITNNNYTIYSNTYKNFKDSSDKFISSSDQIASFCGFGPSTSPYNETYFLVTIGCLSATAIGLIIAIVVVNAKRKKGPDYVSV